MYNWHLSFEQLKFILLRQFSNEMVAETTLTHLHSKSIDWFLYGGNTGT